MKTTQITIERNIPVLNAEGKKVKDAKTGYNVTEEITFKGTRIDFVNDLKFIPDYGKDKRCPVQTACKLSGEYTKLIKNNLKALKLNYCYSADQYKGAFFGTKHTNIEEVNKYLQTIKADKNWKATVEKADEQRKAKKNGNKQGNAIARAGAKGDAIQAEIFASNNQGKIDAIMKLKLTEDKKAELIVSLS